jgi:hypothetical protein
MQGGSFISLFLPSFLPFSRSSFQAVKGWVCASAAVEKDVCQTMQDGGVELSCCPVLSSTLHSSSWTKSDHMELLPWTLKMAADWLIAGLNLLFYAASPHILQGLFRGSLTHGWPADRQTTIRSQAPSSEVACKYRSCSRWSSFSFRRESRAFGASHANRGRFSSPH